MKALLNTETGEIKQYPRADDEPVIGLDPIYQVLNIIEGDTPTIPNLHYLVTERLVEGSNLIINHTVKESPKIYLPAENCQVRAWMIRGGMDPDLVPQIIAQVVPDGPERKEALMRWDYAVRIPRDFPLTNVIGAQMNLTPEQIDAAWPDILAL